MKIVGEPPIKSQSFAPQFIKSNFFEPVLTQSARERGAWPVYGNLL